MADLYNLDAEFENANNEEENELLAEVNNNDEINNNNNNNIDDDDDNVREDVTDAIYEATKLKINNTEETEQLSDNDENNERDNNDNEKNVDLDDLLAAAKTSSINKANIPSNLNELTYTKLYTAWTQECESPELLQLDYDTILEMRNVINDTEELQYNTGREGLDTLFHSLLRVDNERIKFLLADLLQRRLHKIQSYPFYYMRDHTDKMSVHEVEFLKEYGTAIERHLNITVTDHFPQDIWKTLDNDEMIDKPNINKFVFIKAIDDIVLDNNNNTTHFPAGTCLITRYQRIQSLLQNGKVQLMM